MYTHETQLRVRYGETDQMGYLYYGNYAQYFEVGRVELMRSLGLTYKTLETEYGIWMPVVSLEQRFVRPAFYDDLLTLRTTVRTLPERFMTFHTDIFNPQGKLINGGRVRLCFLDAKSQKAISAPAFLVDRLRPHF